MKKQDYNSYQHAWNHYYEKIKQFCSYHLHSTPASVEDCCQEVFYAYWIALKKGQEIQNLQAWLYKVAYNQIKKIQKQVITQPKPASLDTTESKALTVEIDFVEEMLKSRFQDEELIQLVKETLTEEERCIFEGCFLEKKSSADVANELGVQVNYLYKKKWALKQRLAKKIHEALTQAVDELLKK